MKEEHHEARLQSIAPMIAFSENPPHQPKPQKITVEEEEKESKVVKRKAEQVDCSKNPRADDDPWITMQRALMKVQSCQNIGTKNCSIPGCVTGKPARVAFAGNHNAICVMHFLVLVDGKRAPYSWIFGSRSFVPCSQLFCCEIPFFNFLGEKVGKFCSHHKFEGMVDVVRRGEKKMEQQLNRSPSPEIFTEVEGSVDSSCASVDDSEPGGSGWKKKGRPCVQYLDVDSTAVINNTRNGLFEACWMLFQS